MLEFVHEALPIRVVFGAGSLAKLPRELDRLGATKALLLCSASHREQAEALAGHLGGRAFGVYDKAVMHVLVGTAEAARAEARRLGAARR